MEIIQIIVEIPRATRAFFKFLRRQLKSDLLHLRWPPAAECWIPIQPSYLTISYSGSYLYQDPYAAFRFLLIFSSPVKIRPLALAMAAGPQLKVGYQSKKESWSIFGSGSHL